MERDVNSDREAALELQKRGISGVPTFFVGDEVIVGFDRRRLLDIIDHRLVQCEKCGQKMRVPVNKGKIEVTCAKCSQRFNVMT